jgi:sec-independent protein translocase protein TatC
VTGRTKAPPANPEAAMPLAEHLRELRSRLFKSLLAISVGVVVGWVFYDEIFAVIRAPFDAVVEDAAAAGRDMTLAFTGVADPFVMQLKVAGVAGLLLTSPVWLYQLWRFITPGLHRNERRWGLAFAAVATPLFLAGAYLAYLVLPKGLEILLGFTPEQIENIISVDRYLSFFLRMLLVFGFGFLLPLVVVALNFAGVLSARQLRSWWRWIVMGTILFAAMATPTGDPFNLMLLALPLLALMGLAWGVCWANDRRRARRAADEPQWDDDETSPLDA